METTAPLPALNRILIRALKRIGEAGDAAEIDAACRLAAEAWSLLRHDWPDEAQRLNGVMHFLTNPKRIGNKGETDERHEP